MSSKLEAVRLAAVDGWPKAQIARQLGIRVNQLRKWKQEFERENARPSFFHTLKTELVMHSDYRTRDQGRASLFDYVEVFYNPSVGTRRSNYEAPLVFEAAQAAS